MGKNEIDIAVIFEKFKNLEEKVEEIGIQVKDYYEGIMKVIEKKADKDSIDQKIKPIERNQNIIMGIIISVVVAGVVGFMLRYGLGL